MIIQSSEPVVLDMDDRAFLKNFLEHERGKRIFRALALLAPETKDVGTDAEIVASAHQRKGYEKFAEEMFTLIARQPEGLVGTPATEYPSLDDDKAWEDEEKSPKGPKQN